VCCTLCNYLSFTESNPSKLCSLYNTLRQRKITNYLHFTPLCGLYSPYLSLKELCESDADTGGAIQSKTASTGRETAQYLHWCPLNFRIVRFCSNKVLSVRLMTGSLFAHPNNSLSLIWRSSSCLIFISIRIRGNIERSHRDERFP